MSKTPGFGSSLAHSTERRKALHPMAAARSSASSGRRQKSQAAPDRSARPMSSQPLQLLWGPPSPLKPPSIW